MNCRSLFAVCCLAPCCFARCAVLGFWAIKICRGASWPSRAVGLKKKDVQQAPHSTCTQPAKMASLLKSSSSFAGARAARSSRSRVASRVVCAAARPTWLPNLTPPKHVDGSMAGDFGAISSPTGCACLAKRDAGPHS